MQRTFSPVILGRSEVDNRLGPNSIQDLDENAPQDSSREATTVDPLLDTNRRGNKHADAPASRRRTQTDRLNARRSPLVAPTTKATPTTRASLSMETKRSFWIIQQTQHKSIAIEKHAALKTIGQGKKHTCPIQARHGSMVARATSVWVKRGTKANYCWNASPVTCAGNDVLLYCLSVYR